MLRRSLFGTAAAAGLVFVGGWGLGACSAAKAPPATGGVKRFTLTDTHGRTVTEKNFLGKPSAFFFGFTYCPEVCPTTLADLTRWMKALGPAADRLNVVYVSIDPERDTPKQMGLYLTAFDPRIVGLTGTPAQIAQIAKEYRVYYKKVPLEGGSYTMDHTAAIYLMNSHGTLVGGISYQQPSDQAVRLLKALIATDGEALS
jgi:protein SCO1/2